MALQILIPSILTAPAAIRVRSRLQPEEVSVELADDAAFDAEIEARRDTQAAIVETKILNVLTAAEWNAYDADTLARLQGVAVEIVDLRTLASLFESAGGLNDAYEEKADRYQRNAKDLEVALLAGAVATTDGEQARGGQFTPERVDGYSGGAEYSRPAGGVAGWQC